MQPIETVWTILAGDLPGIISVSRVKFPLAVQGKKSFEVFCDPQGMVNFYISIIIWTTLVEDL